MDAAALLGNSSYTAQHSCNQSDYVQTHPYYTPTDAPVAGSVLYGITQSLHAISEPRVLNAVARNRSSAKFLEEIAHL